MEFPEGIWCDFRTGVHQDSGPLVQRRAAGLPGRRARGDHLSRRGRCGGCDGPGLSQTRPLQAPCAGYSCANPPRLILRDSRLVWDWQWDEVYSRVELRWPDDGAEHRVQTSLSRWQRIPESRQYE